MNQIMDNTFMDSLADYYIVAVFSSHGELAMSYGPFDTYAAAMGWQGNMELDTESIVIPLMQPRT